MAKPRGAPAGDDHPKLKPADIVLMVLDTVIEHGELSPDEIIANVRAEEPGLSEQDVDRATKRADRAGMITKTAAGLAFQITAKGRDSKSDLQARQSAPYVAPYARFERVKATLMLMSPSLGPVTGPGGEGKAHFDRHPQTGAILFYGGWIRRALVKASERMPRVVAVDLAGRPKELPKVAWDHVTVKTIALPVDTPLVDRVRRPVNVSKEAVGEILHEALAPGTVLEIEATFPLSHFPEPFIRTLFETVGDVGISPAGSGRGGIWGLAELRSLTVGGRDIMAVQTTSEVTPNGHRPLLHA